MKDGIRRAISLLAVLLSACAEPEAGAPGEAGAGGADAVPSFEVDPGWPREMPDLWIMGSITGVFVDARDHVWVTHIPESLTPEETSAVQDPPIGTCCVPAPVVVEFDPEGNVVQGWGDPATQDISEFPRNAHGIFVDHNDDVWVGTYRHHRVMKFTRSGDLIMTIGRYDENAGSDDTELLGGPAGIWVDPEDNEVFIADGYQNRRVVVFDGETGAYLRHWGAYGEPPDDAYEYDYAGRGPDSEPPRQFSTVHGLIGSNDGLIYVADRRGNRIQVFDQDGAFRAEKIVAPATRASGSSFVVAFSHDAEQRWLYLADGTNHKVWILRRSDLEIVGEFGRGGRQLGQFLRPHGMSVDSHGNILRRRSLDRPPHAALHASLIREKIRTRPFRRLRHDHVSSEPGAWWIHRVAPFHASGDPANLFRRLRVVVAAMPRTHIATATGDYLHAVCRTRLGFRDDLEFRWCPSEGVAHVTSASRIGLFDFGVNRRRVERVRRQLEEMNSGEK